MKEADRLAEFLASGGGDDCWPEARDAIRRGHGAIPPAWRGVYGPLQAGAVDDLFVVAQIGQSLDGRIATATGHSHYINEPEGLTHLHRLRALVEAVIIGVGTACADNPRLTVRRVPGPDPARVVIDPNGRLPADAQVLRDDGARRIVVTSSSARLKLPAGVECIPIVANGTSLSPAAILGELAARGLRRFLVEGGAATVSGFLQAGGLDRLHIVTAPLILGGGPSSLTLAAIDRVDQGLRPTTRAHGLGSEVLFDCDLSAQRRCIGCAKKST